MHHVHATCRSCGQIGLTPILSLGTTPLANRLLSADELELAEPKYPLDLVVCPGCALVQITETVPPEELFGEYSYFSSFSDAMLEHAHSLVRRVIKERKLNYRSLVIEIASNDGYLLQYYQQADVPVLGIEPAVNIAEYAQSERGIPTLPRFFSRELALSIEECGQPADVVHANNVLAHVADLNGFVAGLRRVLKPGGVGIIEVPYVRDLVERVEFDTIYHEHLCYFSLTSLECLFSQHGLVLKDVERLPIHGGSLRLFVGRQGARGASVDSLLTEEAALGINRPEYYRDFGQRVEQLRGDLVALLEKLKSQGFRIAAYGASAKGSTLLNYCGIGSDTIDFVVDRSTVKQGRYTPGTHLAIHSPAKLTEDNPDYALLLSWNFADEILSQQDRYRQEGGRFIIPIPNVRVA
jgi:SAM-dependent methyltransferase